MENVGIVELRKQLLNDILEKYDAKYIINKLYIHRGTFNRWIQKNDIPVYYIGEFNKLLNDKYDISNFINEKPKDQFYTSKYIAEYCYNILLDFLKKISNR